jgi:hypothetical protein
MKFYLILFSSSNDSKRKIISFPQHTHSLARSHKQAILNGIFFRVCLLANTERERIFHLILCEFLLILANTHTVTLENVDEEDRIEF